MLRFAKHLVVVLALCTAACDDDAEPAGPSDAGPRTAQKTNSAAGGTGGSAANAMSEAGSGGRAGRRSALSCMPASDSQVTCGGEVCPTTAKHEKDPCFVPCCVMYKGAERCGFRGTSAAFTTECVMPAVSDPSCDEVPQFEGCCEPTQGLCGVIGGFAPGCQTTSRFATLPEHPKACVYNDGDADAGSE